MGEHVNSTTKSVSLLKRLLVLFASFKDDFLHNVERYLGRTNTQIYFGATKL